MVANALVAVLPVVLFLGVLLLMDSFKLARPSAVVAALGWGVIAAMISEAIYPVLGAAAPVSATGYSRYIAPIIE